MAYCIKCGAKVDEHTKYCQQCGAEIPTYQETESTNSYSGYAYSDNTYNDSAYNGNAYNDNAYSDNEYNSSTHHENSTSHFDPQEVYRNKAMGVLSYLGILVFIPLLAGNKSSQYVRFHTNQGLVLFIATAICNLLSGDWFFGMHSFLNMGDWWFGWIFNLLDLVFFIFMIVGIVYACRGERREFPIIGQIHLLK